MNFEGFSVLTRLTLATNILAYVAFFFLGLADDKVLFAVTTYCCLGINLMMFFMLSDVKFYKTKKSDENYQESGF